MLWISLIARVASVYCIYTSSFPSSLFPLPRRPLPPFPSHSPLPRSFHSHHIPRSHKTQPQPKLQPLYTSLSPMHHKWHADVRFDPDERVAVHESEAGG